MDTGNRNTVSFKGTLLGAVYMGIFICIIGLGFNSIHKNKLELDYTKIPVQKNTPPDTNTQNNINKPRCEPYPLFIDQTKEMYDANTAIFIDSRLEEEFKAGHITGAINIPVDKVIYSFRDLQPNLPIDGVYIIYCGGNSCDTAYEIARYFCQNGYQDRKIFVFEDGYDAWVEAGYSVEK